MGLRCFYYFAKYIIGFSDMRLQPHWEVCSFLQTWMHQSDILMLLPRGTFKSSLASVAYPIWWWLQDRNHRFLLSSYVHDNTKNFIGLIDQNLTRNSNFLELYGDWTVAKQGYSSTKESISVSGRKRFRAEDSITASSLKISKVSQHYDSGIFDDLQTDLNLSSREAITDILGYLELMNPILDPRPGSDLPGPKAVIGTRWGFGDAYGHLLIKEEEYRRLHGKPSLRVMIREGYDRSGNVFFPGRFTKEYLDHLSRTMSRDKFNCQYMNNPVPDESAIFKITKLGWFYADENGCGEVVTQGRRSFLPQMLNYFVLVDPSIGEHADSDYTAIVTVAVDSQRNIYVWEVIREHLVGNDAIIEKLFDVQARYKPFRIGIEDISYQKSLLYGFEQRARESGKWFLIEPLKAGNRISKDMRIAGLEPFVNQGRVYVRVRQGTDLSQDTEHLYHAAVKGVDTLLDEMIRFPKAMTKDAVDALSYAPQLIFPAQEAPSPPEPREGVTFDQLYGSLAREKVARLRVRP